MVWPISQDYNEAIQDPASSFADPELKQGEATTNALGIPMPRSGNFADVYEFICPQRKWAVKCFTRQIPGLRDRYKEVSAYLKQVPLPFMVDFSFLEQGIRVRGEWYPILKMQWVEGFTLNQFVKDNLTKPQILGILGQIWIKLATKLTEAEMAHCDLQHGNVLLVPGSKAGALAVKLVDYDGMCVPALTMLKTIEMGHPNFQHPQRARDGIYGLDVDRFSHLVIYTAVRVLQVGGKAVWDKYDNGDNLLFRASDFEAPGKSPLLAELLKSGDASVRQMTETVKQALSEPLSDAPLLTDVVAKLPAPGKTTALTRSVPQALTLAGAGPAEESAFAGVGDGSSPLLKKQRSLAGSNRGLMIGVAAGVAALGIALAAAAILLLRKGEKPETALAQKAPSEAAPTAPSNTKPPPSEKHQPPRTTERVVPVDRGDAAPPAAEAKTVDLLKLIDVDKHAIRGTWKMRDGVLISPVGEYVHLQIPHNVPAEYELTIQATPIQDGNPAGELFVRLIGGGWPVDAMLDGFNGQASGLGMIDGKFASGNETTYRGRVFTIGKSSKVVYAVRRDAVTIRVDGKEIINWKADYRRVTGVWAAWKSPNPRQLVLGTHRPYEISQINLTELSGTSPEPEAAPEGKTFLSDMPEINPRVGFGRFGKRGESGYFDNVVTHITVNGKRYPNALSTHAIQNGSASVKYRLRKRAQTFATSVAINDYAQNRTETALVFKVLGDDKLLWESKPVQRIGVIQDCKVDVAGVDMLELRVDCPGSFQYGASVWLDPYITTGDGKVAGGKEPAGEKGTVNLISLLELPRDVVYGGKWSIRAGELVYGDKQGVARVEFRYQPPAEYDFVATFSQTEKVQYGICLIMPNPNGGSFFYALGNDAGTTHQFFTQPERRLKLPTALQPKRKYEIVVQVRRDSVRAVLDGKELVRKQTDFKELLCDDWQKIRDRRHVGVSCALPTTFHSVQVVEISGAGKRDAVAAGEVAPANPENKPDKVTELPGFGRVESIAVSADDHFVLTTHNKTMRLWDLTTARSVRDFPECETRVHAVAFSSDGQRAFCGTGGYAPFVQGQQPRMIDCKVRIFDVKTGKEIESSEMHTGWITGLAISADGNRVVSSANRDVIRVWDVGAKKAAHRQIPIDIRWGSPKVAMSADGKFVIGIDSNNSVNAWQLPLGRLGWKQGGHTANIHAVAISPDGKIAASAGGGAKVENDVPTIYGTGILLWDVKTGRPLGQLAGHTGEVRDLAFSKDGKRIASAAGSLIVRNQKPEWPDCTVRVWDVKTRKEIRRLEGHTRPVFSVAFYNDGQHVISGDEAGKIRIWEVEAKEKPE
jgi:hypothetical protein